MATTEILLAGFGGQGILFAGKILAYCGLMDNKELSWLPSYGPEMRGGTCNCSVCISDTPIGSPLVLTPDILVALFQEKVLSFYVLLFFLIIHIRFLYELPSAV